jgi:hypothetical protein
MLVEQRAGRIREALLVSLDSFGLTGTELAALVSEADAELRRRFDCGEAHFRVGEPVSMLGSACARGFAVER